MKRKKNPILNDELHKGGVEVGVENSILNAPTADLLSVIRGTFTIDSSTRRGSTPTSTPN
jgi:hypothetical protein